MSKKLEILEIKGFKNFVSGFKKFWVVQNLFPIVFTLNQINVTKKARSISTFDFSTLYTTNPNKLLKELSGVINFFFESKVWKRIGFSKPSIYWTSKGIGRMNLTKQTLANAMSLPPKNCLFNIISMVFKQDIGMPMGIDPAPLWSNLFIYLNLGK